MMLSLPKYDCYKDSGVDWLGEIPVHWGITRMANFGSFTKGKGISKNDISEQGLPALLYGDIYTKYNIKTDYLITTVPNNIASNSAQIYYNDILFTGSGETLEDIGKCIVYKGNSVGYAGGDVIIFRQNKCNSLYLSYLFNSSFFNEQKAKLAKGQIIVHIYSSKLKTIKFCLPPLEEQEKIVKFLDRKCEEVESAIALKQRLIILLEEQSAIVINQAVTKGLNPNAPMKDSGIDWLGDIPSHWEVTRMANFGSFNKGKGISKNDISEKGLPALLYGDIYTKYNIKTDYLITTVPNNIASNSAQIYYDDILFTGSGETLEDIGKCIVYKGNDIGYAGGDVIIFRQNRYNSLYLSYLFNSFLFKEQKAKLAKGQIIVHIYSSKLKNIKFCIPPIEEQEKIVEYLEQKTAEIEELKEKTLQQIGKLKEFKQILIAEAVTGKIKV
ncbi:restriction endonuclease subunit S [Cyanobacterium stanieri LEGE 03274]|uniref:Restriction endonuclease subunit S n=1 Tax=Cyanobacterium stanieri LEGE 03274 TaxID=1828756 RepID=A0ABR9V7B4_9CHRO|nr:restriction endonuclease subunit S [Cyanobacterium stanieri]MBE9223785.1 restriction endonuclease subunit S [Cyanobacterium stanieri LEGE 03274]